jgi:hypothetical protein
MMAEILKEIYDAERKQRVVIYRNDTGTFGYFEEYFSEDPFEMCWIPKDRGVVGFYDSSKTAETEARANIDWLTFAENF